MAGRLFLVASGADGIAAGGTHMALLLVASLSAWVLFEEYLDAVWIVLHLHFSCILALALARTIVV